MVVRMIVRMVRMVVRALWPALARRPRPLGRYTRGHGVRLVPSSLSRLGRERKYIASRSACRLSDPQNIVKFGLGPRLAIWECGLLYRDAVPEHDDRPLAPGQHPALQHLPSHTDGGRGRQQDLFEPPGARGT